MNHSDYLNTSPVSACIKNELEQYFKTLDGQCPSNLYTMVISEAESALFRYVLEHTDGNQSKAAALLGINRGTLRNKLRTYNIATD